MKASLAKLKESLECSSAALEEGRRALRDRTKKELKKRLQERKDARVRQLVAAGRSEGDALTAATEESREINEMELNGCEELIKKNEDEEDSSLDALITERSQIFEENYEKDLVLISRKLEGEEELLLRDSE